MLIECIDHSATCRGIKIAGQDHRVGFLLQDACDRIDLQYPVGIIPLSIEVGTGKDDFFTIYFYAGKGQYAGLSIGACCSRQFVGGAAC